MKYKNSRHWQYIVILSLIIFSGCLALILSNTETIRDWYVLATYQPPRGIASLAKEDTMTSYAKQLFYVNKPQLQSKNMFAMDCPNGAEQDNVIGCYHSGDRGIYLLNITDSQLNGIIPVTAAYEMLHAGYARLSLTTRSLLDKQMWSFYVRHVSNPAIKKQMAAYMATEPGAQYDELYSVLATEVANLPTNIANQYKPYFASRIKIVDMYNNYQQAFTSRQQTITNDNRLLLQIKSRITSDENTLNQMQATIKTESTTLSSDQVSGNINAYDIEVLGYNHLVIVYNATLAKTKIYIYQYNQLVDSVNSLVLEEQQLIKAISSTPITSMKQK